MHVPVLASETLAALAPRAGGTYLDGTLGGGGHAEAVLAASAPDGRLLGLDRDSEAIDRCRVRLAGFGGRFEAVQSPFSRMAEVAAERGWGPFDGILLDLGVSSFQLDDPSRGFSFREDGPLDMRMDRSRGRTAADLIDSFGGDWRGLAKIFSDFGEEPRAGRAARAVVEARAAGEITGTASLAAVVEKALGGRRGAP
ncbi:MAG: 16S rRNA (cytosine(1402)-N(4))-methyltransferase RsmH, partial [Kiritimatiellae bacterium]|nr:16S rRNA (cytosine(1402)-N(4))-methyltransferase RsmH [Kiritimatiellia bacterium]